MAPRKRKSLVVHDASESKGETTPAAHVVKQDSPSSPVGEKAVDSASSDEEAPSKKRTKKAGSKTPKEPKAAKPKPKPGPVQPLDPTLPTNKTLPDPMPPYPSRPQGQLRISAWNICGLKAAEKKGRRCVQTQGMMRYIEAEQADILVLTETKMGDPNFAFLTNNYPARYSGTAILSKIEPKNVTFGLPTSSDPSAEAGRCITLEFNHHYLIGTYVPNAGQDLKTLPRKSQWNVDFSSYLHQLDHLKPVIWCGDLNVVPGPDDVRNWKTNHNKSAGCTDEEIHAFERQLNGGEEGKGGKLVDVWRRMNEGKVGWYTYFSLRFDCRTKGIGWRLDHFVVSERVLDKVKQCEIRLEAYGPSDHVPIILDFEGEL
ncbi:BQ2448_5647 [Microbotryum intermedium]|uniref:DNA-(apurinic or apyrimidinic site) endonuclease n=1 Tax=Microbotryum intermedium TaxID=269621 RepID=A0A238F4S5_9BASI|nr:BQ2448_5647 [Microbotryum intermedium]